jgi:non-ribosomal peptide synthetase component F
MLGTAFSQIAHRRPRHAAIIHNGQELSYAGLADWAGAIASSLGPAPGMVAVPARHHPGTIATMIGAWLAGGTYCPVDPAFPAARQEAMLAAAGEGSAETAYVLFTSGSTAAPKPVAVSHRAIWATVQSLQSLFGLTQADRVLQFASLNWDTCFEEILPALTTGATLVINDEAYTGSFPRFLRMLEQEQISVLNVPTAYWHELVHHLRDGDVALPESLRVLIIGGEAASPARLADWLALKTGGIRLINTYGCTETVLITHALDLVSPAGQRVPIGRPLPHVIQRVSDEGELLIGGPALADGYRGLPELTARRFVGGFFRTGDRVRAGVDGVLEHLGRLDNELKIRGIRVDPAEAEAHIAAYPGVVAVAVTGYGSGDHTALVAYLTGAADPVSLKDFLRETVPAHLIPSRIVVVAELFHTPSGKLDRRRIKETYQ